MDIVGIDVAGVIGFVVQDLKGVESPDSNGDARIVLRFLDADCGRCREELGFDVSFFHPHSVRAEGNTMYAAIYHDGKEQINVTSNQEMKRTLDRGLLSLPLQSAALKRRLSWC